jgi:oligopeptide/dipeptide ABC transporter ATP-binding protein
MSLLSVKNLKKYYPVQKSFFARSDAVVKAVDGVDLKIEEMDTFALVGESGCGKSTLARLILNLEVPTQGQVDFRGQRISGLGQRAMKPFRKRMQMIFQDPQSSLNPRKRIRQIIEEPLIVHGGENSSQRRARVQEMMDVVGLRPEMIDRYPHEFSGGQRQRVGIARALILQPSFLVCDEPVSALDVSIQAQVINLMIDLQEKFNLTYLFISHDLSVVEFISTRIGVMYLGKLVEVAPRQELYRSPQHPYTKSLLAAVPVPDPQVSLPENILEGDVPSPISPPAGCHFHPRCPQARPICSEEAPSLKETVHGHYVACHH